MLLLLQIDRGRLRVHQVVQAHQRQSQDVTKAFRGLLGSSLGYLAELPQRGNHGNARLFKVKRV